MRQARVVLALLWTLISAGPADSTHEHLESYWSDSSVRGQTPWSPWLVIQHPSLRGPRGIGVTPGNDIRLGTLLVASDSTNQVMEFDLANGSFMRSYSEGGLSGPRGILVDPSNGLFFVCGYDNDEVFAYFFGSGWFAGTFGVGHLEGPTALTIADAAFYVTSYDNSRVVKFDLMTGTYESQFASPSLQKPTGIARRARDSVLYVAGEQSNNVVKFSLTGALLGSLTHPDIQQPQSVAMDTRGHLYVTSISANSIVEFDASDQYVQTIVPLDAQGPSSLCFPLYAVSSVASHGVGPEPILTQVYVAPNPFHTSASVSFILQESDVVALTIHDIAGRLVRKLSDGGLKSGLHAFEWDGNNERRHAVPAGLYYLSLRTGKDTITVPVVLRK